MKTLNSKIGSKPISILTKLSIICYKDNGYELQELKAYEIKKYHPINGSLLLAIATPYTSFRNYEMEKFYLILVSLVTQLTTIVLWSTKYFKEFNISSSGPSLREFYAERKLRFSIHSPLKGYVC